jgi:hypothetical protein
LRYDGGHREPKQARHNLSSRDHSH